MPSEWTIGDGDLVIRFDGAPEDFDTEWFVTLETLRRRQWEDAARVVIVRCQPDFDPRLYLPRAGTEEIRLSVRAGLTSRSLEVKPLIERWRDLLPKEAAVQCAVAYPAVSLDAIGFSSLSGRFLKEVERVIKLRRERTVQPAAEVKSLFTRWLYGFVRSFDATLYVNPFGPSLVEEVVQMIYPNFPHVLVQQ